MDFLEFYNLREHPFSNVVDNRFYYSNPQHETALLKLKHIIDSKRGLAVVIGDIGTGKTTLARRLLEDLDEARYEAALLVIIHSSVSSEWLLKKLAIQLGLTDVPAEKVELLSHIARRLNSINESGKTAVVLMDEVQMLRSKEIMEEFRGLLNMEMPEGKMINFVFFGLNELENVMSLDEPLKQRVAMRVRLKSFSEKDSHDYILHRLKIAGCTRQIYTEEAIRRIWKHTQGIPRLINTICDNSLLEGFLLRAENIDENIIETVTVDLGLIDMSSSHFEAAEAIEPADSDYDENILYPEEEKASEDLQPDDSAEEKPSEEINNQEG